MRFIAFAVLLSAALALLALPDRGHPAPAPKEEAAGPITAAQLKESAKNLEQIALAFHNYNETDWDAIKDWTKYPELVWLNRLWWAPPLLLSVGVWLVLGWSALIV